MGELDLIVKTNGSGDLNNKCKVYFSYHPQDISALNHLSDLLLKKKDIAIYYFDYTKYNPLHVKNDLLNALESMRLIVIPITTHYLDEECFAFNCEFSYALKYKIPILPIISDPILFSRFNEKCGNLQALCEKKTSSSEISFDTKLDNYLESVIFSEEQIQNIKKAFKALLFLSYRKKDRESANKLIEQIHSDERLQDVGIWYDEFLTAGEPFDDEIQSEIINSDMFFVLVTNNTLEPGNYVIEHEIPFAKDNNKDIVLVESDVTESIESFDSLSGLKTVMSNDVDTLNDTIAGMIPRKNKSDYDKDDCQYHLALAYLSGINTIKDSEKAITLLEKLANDGHGPSMLQLYTCYTIGDGVTRNVAKGSFWLRKAIQKLTEECHKTHDSKKCGYLFKMYNSLLDCYEYLDETYNFRTTVEECINFFESNKIEGQNVIEVYCYTLTRSALFELHRFNYDKASERAQQMLTIAISLACMESKYEGLVLNSYLLFLEIFNKTGNIDEIKLFVPKVESYISGTKNGYQLSEEELAKIYFVLASTAQGVIPKEKKEEYFEKAIPLYEHLYKYNPSGYLEEYINLLNQKSICSEVQEKERFLQFALSIIQDAYTKDPQGVRKLYALECWRLGAFYTQETHDFEKARPFLEKAEELFDIIRRYEPYQYLIAMAGVQDCLQLLCSKIGDFEGAKKHCQKEIDFIEMINDDIRFDKTLALSSLFKKMHDMYIEAEQYENAKEYLFKMLAIQGLANKLSTRDSNTLEKIYGNSK